MPNSTTGIMPAPMHNNVQPSNNPLSLIAPNGIHQKDGLFRLNDIHKLAGGKHKDRPQYYLESPQGREMLAIYETQQNYEAENGASYICSVKGKGHNQGTYADFAIALDYASWIDKRFFILLSQYVRNGISNTGEITYTMRANMMEKERKGLKAHLSDCASDLCVIGKQILPALVREQKKLHNEQQPQLPFTGE